MGRVAERVSHDDARRTPGHDVDLAELIRPDGSWRDVDDVEHATA
ncbi:MULTISPECIES: hypothetical protein [Nocardioides]|uniref:Uncharacterized protein n=1 Tax=Nocardioides vastitatis TaxID=2568655 RepID=A0ABW0ZEQ0_9ACTN|nr:hypothetical protein [Nocardioides sp.]